MSNPEGTPVWYELITTDLDAAQDFYARVVGWNITRGDFEGMDYRIATTAEGAPVAGLMKRPDGMPPDPAWFHYLATADVDATVRAIEKAGGALRMPATDIPTVGRIAMLADPQGAGFYVMRGESDEPSRAFLEAGEARPGHAVWNELSSPDPEASIAFYAERFGWRQEGAMPMGDLGDYRFIHSGTMRLGAVMGRVPDQRDGWSFYFMVEDIDAAIRRSDEAGGRVVKGPDEIPGGGFSLIALDPQGGQFGLVGDRRK
ncbi:MAG: VOC family protein [Geminicoccaceae bacterium]|nr:VOC family protein [Geminicoccaceae bacterium]